MKPFQRERLKGMAMVLLAGLCWGTTGTLQEFAPAGAHPLTVGSVRIVLSGIMLLGFSAFSKEGLSFLRRTLLRPLLMGAAGLAGFQFCFFTALKLTGVSVGTLIAIGAAPMFAGVLGYWAEKEPLSKRWFLSTAVAISGCVLLILGGKGGNIQLHGGGITLAFLGSFLFALMGLGLKQQGDALTSVQAATVTTGAAMIIGLPVLLLLDASWILSPRGAAVGFSLGFLTMAFPLCIFSLGLRRIFLRDAYTLSLAEPLTACVLSAAVLGERLSVPSLGGVVLIFLGILLLPASQENTPLPEGRLLP